MLAAAEINCVRLTWMQERIERSTSPSSTWLHARKSVELFPSVPTLPAPHQQRVPGAASHLTTWGGSGKRGKFPTMIQGTPELLHPKTLLYH